MKTDQEVKLILVNMLSRMRSIAISHDSQETRHICCNLVTDTLLDLYAPEHIPEDLPAVLQEFIKQDHQQLL